MQFGLVSCRIVLTVALIGVGVSSSAQQPSIAGATDMLQPNTIAGYVADTAGGRIPGAAVYIAKLRRQTTTDSVGQFTFSGIKPGEYEIAARQLGYYPQVRTVTVDGAGAETVFELVPFPRSLTPVVTTAPAAGISGVIGDTAWNAVPDASVTALAAGERGLTDTLGRFFLNVKPGRHLLRVERRGFASAMASVTVPRDGGRRVMIWLKPSQRAQSSIERVALFDLEQRLVRRSTIGSALVTREDINKHTWVDLSEIVNSRAARRVDPGCDAVVDGGPRTTMIWAVRADEVEAVEVYERQIETYKRGEEPLRRSRFWRRPRPECPYEVYVWLRR